MKTKKIVSLIAVFTLLFSICFAVSANADGEERTLHIKNKDDLKDLARNCSLDSYSNGLTVILDADINLKQEKFKPIPVFNGTFEGNGHSITGFKLGTDGSNQGLFRYIRDNGTVKDLSVKGTVKPQNSRCQVGGIAGVNYGKILNCNFNGLVEGLNYVGGIAGISYGKVENCTFEGRINGKRCTGGIAGYSSGILRGCENFGQVNTQITEGGIELSNFNLSAILDDLSITTAEDSQIVSDTGGIAGYSQGTVIQCVNNGTIGYQRYGYNIGGIAGRQSYFIGDCTNNGLVQGRKDVGGIVGQMEPFLVLITRNEIGNAVNALTGATQAALSNLSANTGPVKNAMDQINTSGKEAGKAAEEIWKGKDIPENWEKIETAMDGMYNGMGNLSYAVQSTISDAAGDFQSVNSAASVVLGLLSNAVSGKLNWFDYNDISECYENQDVTDLEGKVLNCVNYAEIEGDQSVGGIAGSMEVENEFDLDSTLKQVIGKSLELDAIASLKYDSKCVCINNANNGKINGNKENTGGIVGFHDTGTIVNCKNLADIKSDGIYVGGVAGSSYSMIDNCYSMCTLFGTEYVGGIAGLGKIVTDCGTLVRMDNVTACCGAIAGYIDIKDFNNFSGNTFVSDTLGAIDGISYSGYCVPVDYSTFVKNENLPDELRNLSMTFKADGVVIKKINFTYGGKISNSQIPAVPEKPGYTGRWQKFNKDKVFFGETIEAVYTTRKSAIASDRKFDKYNLSMIILEGDFNEDVVLNVEPYTGVTPVIEDGEVLEAWTVSLDNEDENVGEYTLRYRLPVSEFENCIIELYRLEEDGSWTKIDAEDFGNYAGFKNDAKKVTFCAVEVISKQITAVIVIIPVVILLIVIVIAIKLVKRKKKKADSSEKKTQSAETSENKSADKDGAKSEDVSEKLEKTDDSW